MRRTVTLLRWIILSVSFIFLTFGVYITGTKITSFQVPTFSCPYNTEGIIASSCYNLSHMKDWLLNDISSGNIKAIIDFFLVLLIFVVIFGRMLCGFVCPFGFIQDILDKLRHVLKVKPIRTSEKSNRIFMVLRWQILAIFLGASFIGINFCTFCPVILTSPSFAGVKTGIYISGIVAVIIFVGSFFKRRFWCNLCPLGFLIGLFNRISLFKLKKDCQACTECGACYEACPMGIKSIYKERGHLDITTPECLMCTECINKCPEDKAIGIYFLNKKIYVSSRKNFFINQGLKPSNAVKPKVDNLIKKGK